MAPSRSRVQDGLVGTVARRERTDMPIPSPGYSITVRVEVPAAANATAALTLAVSSTGGALTALDVAESRTDRLVVDVTCDTRDEAHGHLITEAIAAIPGAVVRKVSDQTFLLHLGGKIEVNPKVPLKHRDDLSRAYTPGVARVCLAIAEHPEDARRLTIKRNTVAVVTDGSAVLGLGNIGPLAALPVMEGKAALFKQFGGVDAWPVCLDTQDSDAIVATVQAIAPVYGGINLEDISAPRCFEIEARLRELLDIPVFHDDQHGTAIVVLAALKNALRVVDKSIDDVRIVVSGVGAAGHAIIRLLLTQGARDIVACGRTGAVHNPTEGMEPFRQWIADHTNSRHQTGSLKEVLVRAGPAHRRRHRDDGAERHRLRPRQPGPGGRPDRREPARGGRGDRSFRRPEPDQQRSRLPGLLPRSTRRPRLRDHRLDDGRGRLGDRGLRPARRA